MNNLVLFDWLSATIPIDCDWSFPGSPVDGSCFKYVLGLMSVTWEELSGVKGFSKRLYFDGISIHLPSDKMPFCWLEMSGCGCRSFESYGCNDWKLLLTFCSKYCKITRLDVALDDHQGILDMPTIVQDTFFNPCYVSRSSVHSLEMSKNDKTGESGYTVYHGSAQSNIRIRIYDKAAQLHKSGEKWVRVETQFNDENASAFVQKFLLGYDIGSFYTGILLYNLRYCEHGCSDSNKWRWPLASYWQVLVDDASSIRILSSPGVEYNMMNLHNFIMHQAGNSIWTYIQVFGIANFLDELRKSRPSNLPAKYQRIIDEANARLCDCK